MATMTLGQLLVNDVLPSSHQISGPITNKGLHDHLVGLAKSNPSLYVKTITDLKRRGDEIATLEGVSVGLEDIAPNYAERDAILKPALEKIKGAKTKAEREKIVIETQNELIAHTKKHPGTMAQMALSGARGNVGQLMKIVGTPLVTTHPKRGIEPIPIGRSYAEGLTPAEYWTSMPEVRANEVQARISVSEPGEMAKVLVANMIGTIITMPDCGTNSGRRMSVSDGHILDRYMQADAGYPRNTLITPRVVQELKNKHITSVLVRSPMTCAATTGVCQHCQGLSEKGQLHQTGTTVGVRAAQAMAEPLTQMALSARHGVLTVKATKPEPVGLKGVRQYLEIPKIFKHEAVLATKAGSITAIEKAPQGGHYILIGKERLYVRPDIDVTVSVGQHVEEGDSLTTGVPHPAKLVGAKGIGAGRTYFVDALHRVYANEGIDLDKRHLELLAKSEMDHVRFGDSDPEHPEFMKGDMVSYNAFRDAYLKGAKEVPVDDAVGSRLGKEVLHHTVGTSVTPSLAADLKRHGIKSVFISRSMPKVEFVMKPFAMNPLLSPDWMARLSHRYLKGSIQQGVHFGEESDIHGTHPVPAYAHGASLRYGPGGTF